MRFLKLGHGLFFLMIDSLPLRMTIVVPELWMPFNVYSKQFNNQVKGNNLIIRGTIPSETPIPFIMDHHTI